MREVLRLDKKEDNEKPVEFLEVCDEVRRQWIGGECSPNNWDNVMYRETIGDLDYFICWNNGTANVIQYRGHLNSGKF